MADERKNYDDREKINPIEKKKKEEKIDEELEQTFPASDPPSYSKPGNDIRKENKPK